MLYSDTFFLLANSFKPCDTNWSCHFPGFRDRCMTHSGDGVHNGLETQAGPSRILLEMSLSVHNRLERQDEDRMKNNAETGYGDTQREREKEIPDGFEPWVPSILEWNSSCSLCKMACSTDISKLLNLSKSQWLMRSNMNWSSLYPQLTSFCAK